MKHPREISVDGYVTVLDKDKSGNPLQVAVDADDFSRYVVSMDTNGQLLLKHIDERVHIKGLIISENILGNILVKIVRCRFVEEKPKIK